MKIAEIRDLDGPNLFLLQPAIKIEIDPEGGDPVELGTRLAGRILDIHGEFGLPEPAVHPRRMERTGHIAVAFSWQHRRFAMRLAELAVSSLDSGNAPSTADLASLRALLSRDDADDLPEMASDAERTVPVIAITGTNGKTTTTRLICSILMGTGKRVGWTSSAGVYIQRDLVLPGDYTGPAGAARVFEEPDVDIAVLETARGGILLRGLGYESNDVSVVTNVSPDHLGLHGVYTVEGLAEVKRVVPLVTKRDGHAVLNADDRFSLAMMDDVAAHPFLVARGPDRPRIADHIAAGGDALVVEGTVVRWWRDGAATELIDVSDIPIAFGGRAQHMLENALCAAAACLGIGLTAAQVRAGLSAFRNEAGQNRGRLNVFEVDDRIVIVDFAHNELGLRHLLSFGRSFCREGSRLISVVGTAGDRTDEVFSAIGRIAAEESDRIVVKDSARYLRGRSLGDMTALMARGVEAAGGGTFEAAGSEISAFERALELAEPGDVVAIMCIEDYDQIIPRLESIGTSLS